jgi:hypothetical protein
MVVPLPALMTILCIPISPYARSEADFHLPAAKERPIRMPVCEVNLAGER